MNSERRKRVLLAKVGLDSHSRGIKVVAQALRDGGLEVIFAGYHQTPEQIVQAALQEDVDIIGVSILSGAHLIILPKIMKLLREKGLDDIPLVVGGIVPKRDIPTLKEMGVAEVFGPGADTNVIIQQVKSIAAQRLQRP